MTRPSPVALARPQRSHFPLRGNRLGLRPKPQKSFINRGFRGWQSPNSSFLKGKATPPGRGGRNWGGLNMSCIFVYE